MRQRWLSRLALTSAAVGIAALATAMPAWADGTVPINDGNVPTTAKAFSSQDCNDVIDFFDKVFSEEPQSLAATESEDEVSALDGWHFVLPDSSGDGFVSLKLQFDTPGGQVEVTIPGGNEDPLWFGVLGEDGGKDNKHAYLLTEAGWTLTGGEAEVTGTVTDKNPIFNLSHTCPGIGESPSPTPSETPSESPSESGSTPAETSSAPGGGGGGGGLPVTGTAIGGFVVVGVGLVAAGVALLAVRRRREIDFTDI